MKKILLSILVLSLFVLGVYMIYSSFQVGVDWNMAYRPASLAVMRGQSPYSVQWFFNPPWVLIPLLPLATLSPALGSAVVIVLNIIGFLLVAAKSHMNKVAFVVFLLFSGVLTGLNSANIEGLAILGLLLPPWAGLVLLASKPQLYLGVFVFFVVEAYRTGGVRRVFVRFLPVAALTLLSFVLYGFWPLQSGSLLDIRWNASIFPWGLPFGAGLLGLSLWKRDIRFALASSPFFAPYVSMQGWSMVWFGLLLFVPRVVLRRS